jgi:hypothetical protein
VKTTLNISKLPKTINPRRDKNFMIMIFLFLFE